MQLQIHGLEDVNKELKINNQILEKKLEDLQYRSSFTEEQYNKLKNKYDQEQIQYQEEKNKEIFKRKQKT